MASEELEVLRDIRLSLRVIQVVLIVWFFRGCV